tara:strand:+ start:316 stop:654 length:339 start_codon:yes stop_codon:yes gene_type:complete
MVNFDKTPRTASDLSLTRTNQPFSKDVSKRLQTQKLQFTFNVAENQRLRNLKRQTMEAQKRQKVVFEKVQKLESKSETITFDLADKISKIIPYSLIPVIAITAGYLLLKGKK